MMMWSCFKACSSDLRPSDPSRQAPAQPHGDVLVPSSSLQAPHGDANSGRMQKIKPTRSAEQLLLTRGCTADSLEGEGIPSFGGNLPLPQDNMPSVGPAEDDHYSCAASSTPKSDSQAEDGLPDHMCVMLSVDHHCSAAAAAAVAFSTLSHYEARSLSVPMELHSSGPSSRQAPTQQQSSSVGSAGQHASASQPGLVISDEGTACDEQDTVLLNMLYSNAIVVGDATPHQLSASDLYYTEDELASNSNEEPFYSASLESAIIPLNILDPSGSHSPRGLQPSSSYGSLCLDDPPAGTAAATLTGLPPPPQPLASASSSSAGSTSNSPSLGLSITVAGKVVEVKDLLFSTVWPAGTSAGKNTGQGKQQGLALLPWAQSVPLPHTSRVPVVYSRSLLYSVMTSSAPLPGIAEVDDETEVTHTGSGSAGLTAMSRTFPDGLEVLGFLH